MEVSCDLSEVFSMFIELYEFVFMLPAPDVMQFIRVRVPKLTILLVRRGLAGGVDVGSYLLTCR